MSLPEITFCPCTLQPGFSTYSPAAQKALFGSRSKKVLHILPFASPGNNPEQTREFNEKRKYISISGVQEKYSLQIDKNKLLLTATRGTHILKPIPAQRLERVEEMPANEHISMQLASQVFKIPVAACAMIFFNDGSPAYITRRFDYKPDGTKYHLEDFAALLGRSPEKEGDDYKYNASYLDIARMINQYVHAATITLHQFFRLVVFNYLIANGDAHLKNFALMESPHGDYLLTPAYDLMCTALHINDSSLALRDGLYPGDWEEKSFLSYGTYTKTSFIVFAEKAGISTEHAIKIIDDIMQSTAGAWHLIDKSFLSPESKKRFKEIIGERYQALRFK